MHIGNAIVKTFTNQAIVSAITSTIFIIFLGFYLRKRGIFGPNFGKVLTKVVLSVAIAALSFNSFMQPISEKSMHQGIGILVWGFIIYILLIFLAPLLYSGQKRDRKEVMGILTTFGSTTFFGIPIVGAIYGAEGVLYSSIFNIGYRIFLYSYAYIKMSGLKMEKDNIKKMFLNPIVIATILGFILWIIQPMMPTVTVPLMKNGIAAGGMTNVAFYRIDQTAVWLWRPLNYLSSLASPLAWLAIGCTLGSISLKDAVTNKLSWYYSFNKVIIVPLFNLVVLLILNATHILPLNYVAIATVVIMMATPTATVAAAYAISYDREAVLTSNASLLSTVSAVIMMPIWIAILGILQSAGIFH
ncbi:AEC family transporter [Limosilactobacillus coleohominis]|uniref:AEC family transporter n=1 Tax=Limosilactobacillus coleohominis TaxID=181675 RepID=UPI0019566FEF|nr:AEC family transporter [Limosilactobacillus coleohominis]MBM6955260.1 AEC family transporter [Limosilactobacillus coleohominis]HJA24261.1 AEC family transporter [Candidatus Limosilactobacillus intestinavium]